MSASADVVVVGGGVAGLCVAEGIAAAGARVVCIEADRIGAGASGRGSGQLLLGVVEAPHRVLASLGELRTRELFALTRASVDWLADRRLLERSGMASIALDDREPAELECSHEVLGELGVASTLHPAETVVERFGLSGSGPMLSVELGGRVDPGPALASLASGARSAGASIIEAAPLTRIDERPDGLLVHAGEHRITTEVVVLAAGAGARDLEPWLAEQLVPVREQSVALGGLAPGVDFGGRAGHGYTWFERRGHEGVVGGCRWATPHLEVGETQEVTTPEVQARVEGFADRLGWRASDASVRRWAWIDAHTRDGLPLVGPVPGSNRIVACVGFCGNDWGLGPGAAALVTEGLMGETAHTSALFAPSRLLR